ncbi:MAG TPA: YggS family pyridoxal phosphate-dependent enzyme [Baekduia sp.]|nr:YggS family pyridoxal phosphate-dependent enzyme [Baekduia sp.]
MPELITGLTAESVRANRERVEAEIADACARAGRDPADVELLAAVKYVAVEELPVLHEAGLRVLGENRAQELQRKVEAAEPGWFTWDFIGHLQSRKVKQVVPLVRRIHSVSTDSVVRELGRHAAGSGLEVLIEVNISGEEAKSGIAPEAVGELAARCREEGGVDVVGLMTMPPQAERPEDSRRWFAALAQLAADHDLMHLSMGTTQDYVVAVEEGATIVRVGSTLYR